MDHLTARPQPAPTYRALVLDRAAMTAARSANAAAGMAARAQLAGDRAAAEGARALAAWHRSAMRDAAHRARRARFEATVSAIAGDAFEVPA